MPFAKGDGSCECGEQDARGPMFGGDDSRMERKIIVCYATGTGSTGEIAEFIGEEIENAGVAVEVQKASAVPAPATSQTPNIKIISLLFMTNISITLPRFCQ